MAPAGGVSFRELMIGGFAMGETDPIVGEREGARARSFLLLEANAAIPNLKGFLNDPEHTGQLTGSVSFAPLVTRADAVQGEFKLFVRGQQGRNKAMLYGMSFQCQGRAFILRGIKHVPYRSVVHSWKDTTTLYCRLHEGHDESGAVIGAGTLHLKILQFARQLASFRTLNADSIFQKTTALAGFGKFFARELIDTYFG